MTSGVFGITLALSSHAIRFGLDQVMPGDSCLPGIAKVAISYFGGIAIGSLATTAVGFPITFKAALILNLTTLGMILGGFLCPVAAIAAVLAAVVVVRAFRDDSSIMEAAVNLGGEAVLFLENVGIPANQVLAMWNGEQPAGGNPALPEEPSVP
jgi:hypothetical protein